MGRIWDPFLTEHDRAYDARHPQFSKKRVIGGHPVLILVDLYRCAFGDEPEPLLTAVERNRSNLGLSAWNALPHLEMLLSAARVQHVPVIHVTRMVELSEWEEFGHADRCPSMEVLAERERDYEIIDELKPIPGELVVRKRSASAFGSTPLAAVLNQLGAETVIVAGESTSGCVRATVVDARDLRFTVIVPEECVFDRTEASHAINLYDMHRKYAHVIPLSETLEYLETARPAPS